MTHKGCHITPLQRSYVASKMCHIIPRQRYEVAIKNEVYAYLACPLAQLDIHGCPSRPEGMPNQLTPQFFCRLISLIRYDVLSYVGYNDIIFYWLIEITNLQLHTSIEVVFKSQPFIKFEMKGYDFIYFDQHEGFCHTFEVTNTFEAPIACNHPSYRMFKLIQQEEIQKKVDELLRKGISLQV